MPSSSSMLDSGWLWSYTFFLNSELRNEYPRLRDVGESGERLPMLPGDNDGTPRGGRLLALCADPSPSSSGDTSRVFMDRSGVPGFLPDATLFACCVVSSLAVRPLPAPASCPTPCLSTSVENRTRVGASDDNCDIEGRDAFSTAEVRAAGVASVAVWGRSIA
jgi:hypothetical protein